MTQDKYISGDPEVWLKQAEHKAELAHLLVRQGYWAETILQGFEPIEVGLKAVGLQAMTHGGLERFTYGELEKFTHGQFEGKVRASHQTENVIGPQHREFPLTLLKRIKALKIDKERLRVRYPSNQRGEKAPYQVASETRALDALGVMDDLITHARNAIRGK